MSSAARAREDQGVVGMGGRDEWVRGSGEGVGDAGWRDWLIASGGSIKIKICFDDDRDGWKTSVNPCLWDVGFRPPQTAISTFHSGALSTVIFIACSLTRFDRVLIHSLRSLASLVRLLVRLLARSGSLGLAEKKRGGLNTSKIREFTVFFRRGWRIKGIGRPGARERKRSRRGFLKQGSDGWRASWRRDRGRDTGRVLGERLERGDRS